MTNKHVAQIPLVIAVTNHLESRGIKNLLPRQINKIASCCDEIIKEINRSEIKVTPGMGLEAWRNSDHTGSSSLYMADVLSGKSGRYAHPEDASDFGRCIGLIDAVPEYRARLSEMSPKSREWKNIFDNWDNLEFFYRNENYKELSRIIKLHIL